MKTHTAAFKQKVSLQGREIDSIISYELNGETIELGNEELNSITPYYEANILKSIMKQLDLDSNVEIPAGTTINYQIGIKVRDDEVEDYRDNYDYVDYGNYIVKDVEKQEDTNSYKIECYDKMLLTMTDYENLEITYPITVRNYINTLCQHLGLTFANASDIFVNYDKNIIKEFYLEYNSETQEYETMGYTYRDVFDELAQVTASTIVINNNDELEIRYITDSQDTIDEEYLKDINVNFGEQYGPVNSIVFSRSADTDFIYKQDQESIEENGLCEIKISDNQILSQNNRSEFLDGVYGELNGLTYHLNDYTSTGILYYDVCDRYNVSIGETTYSCVMLNDSAEITQGIVEKVYTERPEDSETDYSKSSKDEKTSLIVDKVNKKITAVVSEIGDRSSSQTTISQDIDDIYGRLEGIEEVSTEADGDGVVTIQGLMEAAVLSLKVHPNGSYDLLNRYSSQHSVIGHYHINRPVIVFYNGDISYQYELPRLYYYNNTYDEFILDNVVKKAFIIHRIGFDQQDQKYILPEAIEEELDINTMNWVIGDGTNTVFIPGYDGSESRFAHIELKAMLKNDLTSSFATTVYVDREINISTEGIMLDVANTYATKTELGETDRTLQAKITQEVSDATAEINLGVSSTLHDVLDDEDKVTAASIALAINEDDTSNIKLDADKININGVISANGNFEVDLQGNMTCNDANINGDLVSSKGLYTNLQYQGYGYNLTTYGKNNQDFLGFMADLIYPTYIPYPAYMIASVYIPPGFIVDKAYITIKHNPVTWHNEKVEIQGNTQVVIWDKTTTGYARKVKPYKYTNLDNYNPNLVTTYFSDYTPSNIDDLGGTLINDGKWSSGNGKTFSSSQVEKDISGNIASAFNGEGWYNIGVQTTQTKPSNVTDNSTNTYDASKDPDKQFGQYTGYISMVVNVYGWMQLR